MRKDRFSYDDYLSPFTWRYGTPEMRRLFSEVYKRKIWRRAWIALARAETRHGLLSGRELRDLEGKDAGEFIDVQRSLEVEKKTRHDLVAELRVFRGQAPKGGGKLHLGATSEDIESNADIIRVRQAIDIILTRLVSCLKTVRDRALKYADTPCMGWTHLQSAEPTTLGYRFACYAQDLLMDIQLLEHLLVFVKGKGLKGAVGSSSSYTQLLRSEGDAIALEKEFGKILGIEFFAVSGQAYPRKLDLLILQTLSAVAQSCHKFAVDLRHLQDLSKGEWSEPFGEAQVGSSAMPFKRNPMTSERVCSLARIVPRLTEVAWENAANTILERTLDDSANRRLIIPYAFLITEECLNLYNFILRGLIVYPESVRRNLERYGPFAAMEAVLNKLMQKGEDRQKMYERLQRLSRRAWPPVCEGKDNPLPGLLKADPVVKRRLTARELNDLLNITKYTGNAARRAKGFMKQEVDPLLKRYKGRVRPAQITGF